jgi:hypothetical protein
LNRTYRVSQAVSATALLRGDTQAPRRSLKRVRNRLRLDAPARRPTNTVPNTQKSDWPRRWPHKSGEIRGLDKPLSTGASHRKPRNSDRFQTSDNCTLSIVNAASALGSKRTCEFLRARRPRRPSLHNPRRHWMGGGINASSAPDRRGKSQQGGQGQDPAFVLVGQSVTQEHAD